MPDPLESVLGDIEKQARERIAKGEDEGHKRLITDLRDLLADAEKFEFHDYLNERYAMPKVGLVQRAQEIIHRVKEGNYDN